MDKNELEKIYNDNFKKIYRFFYYKSQNKTVAQDLTSETFLGLAEYFSSQKKIENPQALLFAIARNIFNKYLKKKYEEVPVDIQTIDLYSQVESFDKIYSNRDKLLDKLSSMIKKLPAKQKQIMKLKFEDKLILKEIAARLKKDVNYVKTTQRRAFINLRKMIDFEH